MIPGSLMVDQYRVVVDLQGNGDPMHACSLSLVLAISTDYITAQQ